MSLGKRKGSGNILPLLKFDARSGSFYQENRVQTLNGWEKEQTDVTDRLRAVFDLANAERGWIKFPRGAAPEMVLVLAGEDPGEAPDEGYREGFRLLVKMDKTLGGQLREFMSTSLTAWNGISALHDAYLAEVGQYPGQLPIVVLSDVIERRYLSATSFEPVFIITGWVPRPEEFGPVRGLTPKRPEPQTQQQGIDDDMIPFLSSQTTQ
jgi:hypothetical protein